MATSEQMARGIDIARQVAEEYPELDARQCKPICMYVSGRVDFETAEPFALTTYFGWIWFRGGQITPQELEQLTPMLPLIAFTSEERSRVHEVADSSMRALRLHAAGLEHWGASQPSITAVLTEADHWRAIAEKTGAR